MIETHAVAAAAANLCAAILCAATAIWTSVAGEAVWRTVLLAVLGAVNLLTAGVVLRGEARR